MDIDPPSLIYDEFPPLPYNSEECTTFDDFDEFLPKTDSIDFLSDHKMNQQQHVNFGYDSNKLQQIIPIDSIKTKPIFNPDEFLNYYQPDDNKFIYTDRNTPSPTNSSTSSFSSDSTSSPSMTSTSSSNNQNGVNMILDTPPISPSESIQYNSIGNQQTRTINGGPVNLLPGTAIPIAKIPNLVINNKAKQIPLISNQKQKTILLSSKDYKNLMDHYKGKQNSPPKLIVKKNVMSIGPKITPQHQIQNINPKILPKPEIKMMNSIIDEKTLKKQQRMIKNRKSACLSRLKKKDYVTSLEQKLTDLEKENTNLKVENTSLRCQLDAFTKQCLCNCKRKFSDILSLNNNNRRSLTINKILMGSTLRKNTAVLLAMVFMVSINFGTINKFLNPGVDLEVNNLQNSLSKQSINGEHYGVRSLLWINDDNNNATIKPNYLNHTEKIKNLPLQSVHKKICPMYINQTENLRLATELQKWIDTNDYLNLSTPIIRPFQLPSDYINTKNIEFQTLLKNNNYDIYMKKNKRNYFNRNILRKSRNKNNKLNNIDEKSNPIEIYQPKLENKYTKLFDEIRRRNDTFYVVSFNTEHILLPASAYNKSSRPRMSLMLPASDTLLNGKFTLMQIDCEVLNTTLVQLKEELIPKNLRPKFNNKHNNNNNKNNENFNNSTQDKNTTESAQNQKFNNITKQSKLLNRIRKYHSEINELSDMEVDDNEFNKKRNKFNIYKPYFINAHFEVKGNGNITNNLKINDNLLP